MTIAFITFKSSLVPLIEGLCSSNPWEFEFAGFRRNQAYDLCVARPHCSGTFADIQNVISINPFLPFPAIFSFVFHFFLNIRAQSASPD